MLNYIWGFMILIGVIYGAINGTLSEVGNAALDSSKEAIQLCITMMGVMSFWVGLMEIAKDAGIIHGAMKYLEPIIHFLFPKIPRGHKSLEYISTNIVANILGLGWAATPAGLKAMEELSKLSKKHEVASNEMCTFLVLNISSLQLIPVNIIAYRSQYGSVNPTAVIGPGIVATLFSTVVAVVFCKCMVKFKKSD